MAATWTGTSGGPRSHTGANSPGCVIRVRSRWQEGWPPGLEHPGDCGSNS